MRNPASVAELVNESLALEEAGDTAAALQGARRALDIARKEGDPLATAEAMVALARIRFHLGQYTEARTSAQEALTLAPPDSPAHIEALLRLGSCASETGSLAEAEGLYWHAANLAREFGYPLLRFRVLHNLAAGIYMPRGQFDLALSADEEAYRIASEQRIPGRIAYPLITIAWVCLLTQRYQRARNSLVELERIVSPGSAHQGYHLCLSAHLSLDEDNLETARNLYSQARSIAEATGEPWLNIYVRLGMSRCHRAGNDAPTARIWADEALAFAQRVGYRHEQGNALIERSRAAWLVGDLPSAEADLRAAMTVLAKVESAFDLTRARFLLAVLLKEQSRAEAAAAWREAGQAILAGGYAFLLEQERELAYPLVAAHLNHPETAVSAISQRLVEQFQRVPPPPLQIVTLGRFEARQGQRRVEQRALRQRRAGELLALLALAPGRSLSTEEIIEALWPERELAAAQTAIHHATSALRRALEPELPDKFPSRYLATEEGRITLCLPPGSEVDVETMESHYRQGEWEIVLRIYGGDFLPEYSYADWSLAPREQFSILHRQALLAAAQARFDAGRFAEVLEPCRRILAAEPWQEAAVLLGMRACAALNDRAGARRLYLTLEETLRKDLNTLPQEELQAFYRSLTPPA